MVQLLLEAGADPNIDSGHGLPICYVRDKRLAECLIGHGADINRISRHPTFSNFQTNFQAPNFLGQFVRIFLASFFAHEKSSSGLRPR
jgi:hypothetical protein